MKKLLAAGISLVALLAVAWWWMHRETSAPAPHVSRTRRLDLTALRDDTARRVTRAKQLARHLPPSAGSNEMLTPDGRFLSLRHDFIDPQCWLGPREVCDALSDLVTSCDAGSAADCAAVGQYIADAPPRLHIGVTFFLRACQLGDKTSCDRFEALKIPSDAPCEQDVFACSRRARQDLAKHDEACTLGAADSCAVAAGLTEDPELSRAYVETGCQLGSPILCQALAVSLAPDCVPSEIKRCYPPDEAEAKLAREMACSAGWTTGIDCH